MKTRNKYLIGIPAFLACVIGYGVSSYNEYVANHHIAGAEKLLNQSLTQLKVLLKKNSGCDLEWYVQDTQSVYKDDTVTSSVVFSSRFQDIVLLTYQVKLTDVKGSLYYDAEFLDADKADSLIKKTYVKHLDYCIQQKMGI